MSEYAHLQAPAQKPTMTNSLSADEDQTLSVPIVHRHRKTVSTGGGRAWSDAEEAYLIETREHKMPYKHIAAQLKKTELACRLHYHQLSLGSKSRRQPSTSPHERQSAPPSEKTRRAITTPQRQLPSFSSPSSPPEIIEFIPSEASGVPQNHKNLLPKPNSSLHRRESQRLRLVTEMGDLGDDKESVDIARLDRIYEEHRLQFWSTIALSYGCNLSPATLEEAWCRAHALSGSRYPPTPRGSPEMLRLPSSAPSSAAPYSAVSAFTDASRSFTPINTAKGPKSKPIAARNSSFSVSSLLTDDREVRPTHIENGSHRI